MFFEGMMDSPHKLAKHKAFNRIFDTKTPLIGKDERERRTRHDLDSHIKDTTQVLQARAIWPIRQTTAFVLA
jgi:hypothetical protein